MNQVVIDETPMRAALYDILTGAVDTKNDPDIAMGQQMGVSLSSAVLKEKGVLNIQMQSVAIKNIMVKVTDALKLLDTALSPKQFQPEPVIKEIEKEPDPSRDIALLIETNLESGVTLDEFLTVMAGKYAEQALKDNDFKINKTAKDLGISYARLTKLRKRFQL